MAKESTDASPVAKHLDTPAPRAKASKTETWRQEPGGATIPARRKAQRSNPENAAIDNGERGDSRARSRESAEAPRSLLERRRDKEKCCVQRTPDQNGRTQMIRVIYLSEARREEADRVSFDDHERRAAAE